MHTFSGDEKKSDIRNREKGDMGMGSCKAGMRRGRNEEIKKKQKEKRPGPGICDNPERLCRLMLPVSQIRKGQ